jgi:CBS domain-containing protein
MAEEKLGPAPVSFAWMVAGSQARHEQSTHTDQDNALIISDEMAEGDDEYFQQLARFVSDGLNACGYVYCPGDVMATNSRWRQTSKVWLKYFTEWIEIPEPKALMHASIFFDMRTVYGDERLYSAIHQQVLGKSQNNGIFIAYMAANALHYRPPLGFFRQFVLISGGEHDDTFDIKHKGIVPITDIARVLALSEGIAEVSTTGRLLAAIESKAVSKEMGENLIDALEFIANLRIRHQAYRLQKNKPADNYVQPDRLSQLERNHLKDAFSVIKTMQDTLESRYQTGRL